MTSVLLSLTLQQPSPLPQKREQQSETCSRTPGSAVGRRSQAAFEFALELRGMGANAVGGTVLSSEGRRSPARRHVAALGACVRVLSSSRLINHSILSHSGRAIGNGSEKHRFFDPLVCVRSLESSRPRFEYRHRVNPSTMKQTHHGPHEHEPQDRHSTLRSQAAASKHLPRQLNCITLPTNQQQVSTTASQQPTNSTMQSCAWRLFRRLCSVSAPAISR
ncbi:hypothetical protein K456DRAFT_1494121 [Colletotrichum gloeosporioides 23]|nr:hypothetical protein K456DRAFT_1494121 [Colletotrichum gloeosporioides 23]